jgi:hypothetical protein
MQANSVAARVRDSKRGGQAQQAESVGAAGLSTTSPIRNIGGAPAHLPPHRRRIDYSLTALFHLTPHTSHLSLSTTHYPPEAEFGCSIRFASPSSLLHPLLVSPAFQGSQRADLLPLLSRLALNPLSFVSQPQIIDRRFWTNFLHTRPAHQQGAYHEPFADYFRSLSGEK